MNKGLELRMFGIAPFQLGALHAGIQFQHAATLYGRKFPTELHSNWADNWMTSIVKNGGSTNNSQDPERRGSVNKFYDKCIDLGIDAAAFTEITMGDQVTCVTVIADERVFDTVKYPDIDRSLFGVSKDYNLFEPFPNMLTKELAEYYNNWVETVIGGVKNLFLREELRRMPLWKS